MTEILKDNYDNSNDQYPEFEESVVKHFNDLTATHKKIFKTDAVGLFDAYLNNLPTEAKQHYNCNACKYFIEKYGKLVFINEDGSMVSSIWDESITPIFFRKSVAAMKKIVLKSKVVNESLSSERILGIPTSNGWNHLHVKLPVNMVYSSRTLTAKQAMAEKLEDHKMFINALLNYDIETIDNAIQLLESGNLYRGDKFIAITKYFKEAKEIFDNNTGDIKNNLIWLKVVNAPTGFTHIKSSMVGTLLDNIKEEKSFDAINRDWSSNMGTYQRSQSAPTEGGIAEAEKFVEKMGLQTALLRRYAKCEEIPEFIWQNNFTGDNAAIKTEKPSGVFSNITPKGKTQVKTSNNISMPATIMTWDKFCRTVLPTAENIEALVDNPAKLMALVTAADPTAENILQWGNTFSWYYHGGIDSEMKRRVEEAGGRYENNEIRCTLMWEGGTDLDIHCVTPRGSHIYYSRSSRRFDNGELDVDMNGLDRHSMTPVENIRFIDNALEGHYRFYVNNYNERGNGYNGTPFKVELDINGKIYNYIGKPLRDGATVTVFEFDYKKGKDLNIQSNSTSAVSSEDWNVAMNSFVKVNAITKSCNLWGKDPVEHVGNHTFFLLEGCKDLSEGKGRGFFNETLISELRPYRKVLEAYTSSAVIDNVEDATACGLGYSKENQWELTLKVTSKGSSKLIKIDRFD